MFQNNARRNRRQFQPAVEGLSLRIAPSGFTPTGFGDPLMDQVSMPTCGPEDMMVEQNGPRMGDDLGVSMPVC